MSKLAKPHQVRDFWLTELEPKDWYVANDAVDAKIRARFLNTWKAARDGDLQDWLTGPDDVLAYLLVTDQFSRNMFRGDGRSFATDTQAVAATNLAIENGWDLEIAEPERQFIYVPLMHAEDLGLQDKGVQAFTDRMSEGNMNLLHAKAHRWVIAQYGRFPYRNEALGRETTTAEQTFLDDGGYKFAVAQIEADAT